MKKPLILLALCCFCVPVVAQEHEAEQKLVQFQMVLLKRSSRPMPRGGVPPALRQRHMAYYQSLLTSGKAIIAGPIQDDPELVGVAIFNTKSADDARAWATADPAVTAGFFNAELHPWWSEDVFKKDAKPSGPMIAYLAFLVRGNKWTPDKTPETEAIQKAHLANIVRLNGLKKLVVAGPFGDDGTLRGIFVFRVSSIDEARSLAATDPAVQAGRLALEIHPWIVPDGILP